MRERIMLAAMEEMNEHGIKFTMEELARSLGISKRTLYENFASKEELIGAIIDDVTAEFREKWKTVMSDDSLNVQEKIIKIITVKPAICAQIHDRVSIDIKKYMPQEWKKAEDAMDEKWRMIECLLEEGVREGCFRPVFFPAMRAMFKGSFSEFANSSFLLQHKVTIDEMIAYMTDILMHGFMAADNKGERQGGQ